MCTLKIKPGFRTSWEKNQVSIITFKQKPVELQGTCHFYILT